MTDVRSTNILVAAGEGSMREYLDTTLGALGYTATIAKTFDEARHCVVNSSPRLLICDIRLGDFNGLHLGWLRRFADPGAPTIVTHVLFDSTLDKEARNLGAPYVVVPTGAGRLADLVDSVFDRRFARHAAATPSEVLAAKKRRERINQTAPSMHRREDRVWKGSIFQS